MDEKLIKILACPKCKSGVEFMNDKIICKNPECGLKYPVKDGIPVMLIEEAEKQR
ncbi:MAG: Trm112 family protein [Candidatus Omnitrophica bacterium]|nr:Trm112 family protein [Candidatus Omnitrophota bacterium]MDD5310686.1 Trm112 family protein [Candidatus Omnitrophota bacterium]MDD5545690.1 Trm112 family protein [Candidatus Omnitrophota bacterium]